MSVAASDDDGSDEKQSVVRRRTITGGLITITHLVGLYPFFEVRPAREEAGSQEQFPPRMLTRTLTLSPLTLQHRLGREPARRNS